MSATPPAATDEEPIPTILSQVPRIKPQELKEKLDAGYDRALGLSRQALSRCEGTGLFFHRRLALGDIGAAAAALGDVDLARRYLRESLSMAHCLSNGVDLAVAYARWALELAQASGAAYDQKLAHRILRRECQTGANR